MTKELLKTIDEAYFKIQYCVGKSIAGTFFFSNMGGSTVYDKLSSTIEELFEDEIASGNETVESIMKDKVIMYDSFDAANWHPIANPFGYNNKR